MRARAGQGLELGHFIISLRHRDANRVAETMSAFIGEHPAHEIVGEKFTGLPFSTSFLSVAGGEERSRKNGRVDLGILSVAFFSFFSCIAIAWIEDFWQRRWGELGKSKFRTL